VLDASSLVTGCFRGFSEKKTRSFARETHVALRGNFSGPDALQTR